eukprot:scaffold332144_cov24-Attheya_sp.AAC.1
MRVFVRTYSYPMVIHGPTAWTRTGNQTNQNTFVWENGVTGSTKTLDLENPIGRENELADSIRVKELPL